MSELLPCPFCGSKNIDAKGWASTDRDGPACDDCGGTADTIELWNSRSAQQERWQPIETAPLDPIRDPPLVMLWVEGGGHKGVGTHAFGRCYRSHDGNVRGVASGFLGNWSIRYWMPLPNGPAVTSTSGHAAEKIDGGAPTYCAHCEHEHQLHEDARGFHHVIRGERVPCCSFPPAGGGK